MPRTIEHIVACHQAATALRKEGRSIWHGRANIKDILQIDPHNETPEHIATISTQIARSLRTQLPSSFFDITHHDCDPDFIDTVEMMEECTVEALMQDEMNGVAAVDMLNSWLETIYDWGDKHRVWIG